MDKFGLEFLIGNSPEVPRGFSTARILLGDFSHSDTRSWTKDKYIEHWKISARNMLDDLKPVLFCGSFEPVNVDIWLGMPDNKHVIFYNRLVKRKYLRVDGMIIKPKEEMSNFIGDTSGISTWIVNIEAIKEFYL